MGEIVDFEEYQTAKKSGVSVQTLREHRKAAQQLLKEIEEEATNGYIQLDDLPEGYDYLILEDIELYEQCAHTSWIIVEEDYQAVCKSCRVNAWSAPW